MLIRSMHADDYDSVIAHWDAAPGIGVNDCDTRAGIAAYLERNPGLSQVAEHDGTIVATLLCGHDGRRGYLHHMWVAPAWRRQGLASMLFYSCMCALRDIGLHKAHLMVQSDNISAQQFWSNAGCVERQDLKLYTADCEVLLMTGN